MSEPAKDEPEVETIDLSKYGAYTQDDIAPSAYARVLVLGGGKIGKTTTLVSTSPKPLIINCDGDSATKYPAKMGAKFIAVDATTRMQWKKAQNAAKEIVEAGAAKSVIVDSVSLLANNLVDELSVVHQDDKRALYGELLETLMRGFKRLMTLPAHVFFVAHVAPDFDEVTGVCPLIAGQTKMLLPAFVNDWALMTYDGDRTPERAFVLGSIGKWSIGGRGVKKPCVIPATVPALCREIGVTL